jgi:hypothetical protein
MTSTRSAPGTFALVGGDMLLLQSSNYDRSIEPKDVQRHLSFDEARHNSVTQRYFGKTYMTFHSAKRFGHAFKAAGAGAILLLSVSAGHAQSGPFAGFDGAWSGTGTVSMSDGSSERIRCRATYKVDGGGSALAQTLRCASDSYKFDLSSNVTSQGNNVSGSWSEASRNVYGNLVGKAGGGQIDVFVEAAGFAANITLTTRGNKQSVSISSKGEIRGVSINMVKS